MSIEMTTRQWFPRFLIAALLTASACLGGVAAAGAAPTASAASTAPPPGPHGPRGGHRPGLAGVVQGVSGSGFTLLARGTTYTVSVAATTTYDFAPGLAATLGDVTSGERVAVVGTTTGTAVTASAVHIHLWGVRGTVTAVQGMSVAIREASGRTATIQLATTPDVAVGQQVEGFGTWQDDTLVARAFRVVPAHLDGVVQSVMGNAAQVKTADGQNVTVTWTATTQFTRGRAGSGTASLITTGVRIHAEGQWNGSVFAATHIDLPPAPPTSN